MMWAMALTSVVLVPLAGVIGSPSTTESAHSVMWTNRAFVTMGILATAFIIDKRQQADHELREAIRARDIYLMTLAHELRNPLATLRNSLAVMQRTGVNAPGSLLEIMDRQATSLVRLVDDLLEVSRIKGGKIDLRPELVDLSQIVRSAVEANKPSIEQAGQSVLFTTEPETPTIQADPVRLSQVFTNLLDKASKFTPAGGCIDVSIKHQGDYLVTTVRDDGRGISPEALPTIFELFKQAEDSICPSGLGIGLALVKQIVELHHGFIETRSDGVDKGSEFIISLPVA
ncbi:HAMP domain-containing sensor histidine kinase [Methylocystis sp. IM3]|uniref:sensor histidine kinase n=1 Tax=unclassified Methylocystis TaxID=2625913 RepID=UPI0030FA5A5D